MYPTSQTYYHIITHREKRQVTNNNDNNDVVEEVDVEKDILEWDRTVLFVNMC